MALFQTGWPLRQQPVATAGCAGVEVAQEFVFTVAGALAVGDKIELGVLPAGNSISDAIIVCESKIDTNGTATLAYNVGLMSGEVGDADASRTVGNEIFAATTAGQAAGVTRATAASAFTIAPSDADRSIGIVINTAAATIAAPGTKLRVLVKYRAV